MSVKELEADMAEWLALRAKATRESVKAKINDALANIKAEQEVAMAMEKQPQSMDFFPNADELDRSINVLNNMSNMGNIGNIGRNSGVLTFVPDDRAENRAAEAKSEKSTSSSLQYGRRARKREDERRGDLVQVANQLRILAANMTGTDYIRKATRERYASIAWNARTCIQDCLNHHSHS